MGELQQKAKEFRALLLNDEREASARLASGFEEAYRGLLLLADALIADIKARRDSGESVSKSWLLRLDRLQTLEKQAREQMARYGQVAAGTVTEMQRRAAERAQSSALETTQSALLEAGRDTEAASLSIVWNRLPAEALREFVGVLSDGSPVASLFDSFGAQASEAVRNALLTGIAAGENPKRIATRLKNQVGMALPRARTIARTETLRAYRSAAIEIYKANSDVVEGWVWVASLSGRTCPMCLAMHGTRHPVTEEFASHPNCRCSPVPLVEGVDYGKTGEEWLADLPEGMMDTILGRAGGEAYRNGDVSLKDFVGETESEKWGTVRYARSLKSAIEDNGSRA